MISNHTAYKYEIMYMVSFVIIHCFTNDMVNLQCGPTKNWYNIRQIKPYKCDIKVKDISSQNMYDDGKK